MKYFYEFVKTIYFVMTIFVGVFFLRGELIFPLYYESIITYLMPGYLILCGLMIGYSISKIRISFSEYDESKILLQGFIIGTVVGLITSILYVVL